MSALSSKNLFNFFEFFRGKLAGGVSRFVVTFHFFEQSDDKIIHHHYLTQDFPKIDLMQCAKNMEEYAVRILKNEE